MGQEKERKKKTRVRSHVAFSSCVTSGTIYLSLEGAATEAELLGHINLGSCNYCSLPQRKKTSLSTLSATQPQQLLHMLETSRHERLIPLKKGLSNDLRTDHPVSRTNLLSVTQTGKESVFFHLLEKHPQDD